MRYGVMFANTGEFADPAGAKQMGQVAEATGFESVWTVEHVIFPTEYESSYPYAAGILPP